MKTGQQYLDALEVLHEDREEVINNIGYVLKKPIDFQYNRIGSCSLLTQYDFPGRMRRGSGDQIESCIRCETIPWIWSMLLEMHQ